jgi:translation initiation factor IF-1
MTDEAGGRATVVAGRVTEILPRALYRVAIGDGHEVVAHAVSGAGRNFVRLVVGDEVTVALTARDRTRGRIVKKGSVPFEKRN